MEKIILFGTEKHLENNAVIGDSQQGFLRGNPSCWNWFFYMER